MKNISRLSKRYKKCPIFISSRPDDVVQGIDDFSVFRILPLDLESASNLIKKLSFDSGIKSKFIQDLSSGLFDKHESFLSNPLLLSIMLLTYGENAEIPSKLSIFYNQAYEALFQRHDAKKAGYRRERKTSLDIQDFSRVFSLFSLQTYEKRVFKMSRIECLRLIEKSRKSLGEDFKPEDYLSDLLTAACLMIEDGLEIAYSHRSFQEYFVALHISTADPDTQEILINRYWKNMNSDNVIHLLSEINPDLVERVLIVPKLEKLFKEIGVKRFVGITHSAKYIKKLFVSINIEKDGIFLSRDAFEANESSLVIMAIKACGGYVVPSKEYFYKYEMEMLKKYGNGGEKVSFDIVDLSYKSPIMADLLNAQGLFSLAYIRCAYNAFESLKLKHMNRSSSLDELLDI
jgi:hypothetical protein